MKKRARIPSLATLWVIGFISDNPLVYGGQMTKKGGIHPGTLYPLLASLIKAGMLDKVEEDDDPEMLGRPVRVYYRLTAKGERYAKKHYRVLEATQVYMKVLMSKEFPIEPIGSSK